MTLSIESRKSVDAYLAALRRQLRDLLDEDVKDIVEEIRMHILDKTAEDCSPGAVAAALAALGNPEELAARYRTEELLQRAKLSRTPAYMLHSLLHWALLSLLGRAVYSWRAQSVQLPAHRLVGRVHGARVVAWLPIRRRARRP